MGVVISNAAVAIKVEQSIHAIEIRMQRQRRQAALRLERRSHRKRRGQINAGKHTGGPRRAAANPFQRKMR